MCARVCTRVVDVVSSGNYVHKVLVHINKRANSAVRTRMYVLISQNARAHMTHFTNNDDNCVSVRVYHAINNRYGLFCTTRHGQGNLFTFHIIIVPKITRILVFDTHDATVSSSAFTWTQKYGIFFYFLFYTFHQP